MSESFKFQIKLFLRFSKYILPYREKWVSILVLSIMSALLGLVNPYLTKYVVDRGIVDKNIRIFIVLAVVAGGILVLNAILNSGKRFLDYYINSKINFDLNKELFKHIQQFPIGWFNDKSTGEHIYKFDYDLEVAVDFVTNALPKICFLFLRLVLTIIIVFYLNWQIAILSCLLAPLLYLPPCYFNKAMLKAWGAVVKKSEEIINYLQETFSHIQVIKTFGQELSSRNSYLKKIISKIRLELKTVKLEIFSSFIIDLVTKTATGMIFFYGGYQVIKGSLSLGSLTAIMVYLTQLMGLQNQFATFAQNNVLGFISCQRIVDILDEKPGIIEPQKGRNIIFKKGKVEFKNISFGYNKDEYILKNINFCVEDKKHISLVGPSGCGKTTLLNLLIRLYDPLEGDILIDDHNVKDINNKILKKQIGFALQEPFLWNDTLENNVKYADNSISEDKMVKIVKLVGLDEFVKNLPKMYKTIIGENACKLSEGQKQRIAIARALVKNPRILIFDEAMSSVDSESEKRIISNIKENYKEITLIAVSHRLSSVMNSDLVYFLTKNDEIIISRAKDLLKNNRNFSDLFSNQNNAMC